MNLVKFNDNNKIKFLKSIFNVYNNFKFQINNIELLQNTFVRLDKEEISKMKNFLNLINQAITYLDKEEQEIIRIIFIDKIHYSKCNYSQSTYFHKRKIASSKFYNLIFSQCKYFELADVIHSNKIN